MLFLSTALALAAIPAAVLGAVHNVAVGANGTLTFNPNNITANDGDQINFMFMAKNHSVTQSSFASPCTMATFNNTPGINSGFLNLNNVTVKLDAPPTWSIMINGTGPLWFHCAQTVPVVHCQRGMVFSINATPQKSFAAFVAAAEASGNSSSLDAAGASQSPVNAAASSSNGASRVAFGREAAGLLTIVAIGAALL